MDAFKGGPRPWARHASAAPGRTPVRWRMSGREAGGPRPRHDVQVDPRLAQWLRAHVGPDLAFYSVSHAFNVAMRRVLAEEEHARRLAKQSGFKFDAGRYWTIHAEALAATRPNERGRPRDREAERMWAYLDVKLKREVLRLAEPSGPFAQSNPVSHAIEFGLRRLQDAEQVRPVQGPCFAFDEKSFLEAYQRA